MNNDQCDGSGPHVDGQVRVLPLGSESNHGNAILCLGCFNREMQFRKERNRAASRNCLSLIPKWEDLKVYGEEPPAYEPEPRIYRIIRFRKSGGHRTIRNHCTLSEVKAYCHRPDTKGPGWFDGFDYMRGCAPKEGDK